jgi:hypothetical protein
MIEKRRIALLVTLILALTIMPIFGDGRLTGEITALSSIQLNDSPETWTFSPAGITELTYSSVGNANVKSEISLQFILPGYPIVIDGEPVMIDGKPVVVPFFQVPDAWIKARFPSFRITVGKTRLSWGDGFFFNAGDLLFGSTGTEGIDLTADELRTQTAFLTAAQVPFGPFTFAELVIMPADDLKLYKTRAGGRYYTTLGDMKAEFGYLHSNQNGHQGYTSFQGNIGPDWYASLSSAVKDDAAEIRDNLNISFGLFHVEQINRISSLNLRLEGLVRPFTSWEQGLLHLYPELSYSPSQEISFSLRAVVAPQTPSAEITAGMQWNLLQGFTLLGYLSSTVDNSFDGAEVMVGINYIY